MAKKVDQTFRINGHVIDGTTRQGIARLRVEAWDKDLISNDLVGSSVTDEQGAFQIEFTSSYFAELFLDQQPDLFFKVFREELIKSTEDSVLWNVAAGNTKVVIEVDVPAVAKPEETFVVRGHIAGASAGQFVRAYDRDFRGEEFLGKSEIDPHSNYEIRYRADRFQSGEKGTADLRVAVCEPGGGELVSSEIHFNAGSETTIDLIAGPGPAVPSEYERHLADLEPVLQGVALIDIAVQTPELKEKDLDFLAGDADIDRQHIAWLVQAAKVAHETRGTTETATGSQTRGRVPVLGTGGIPAEVFYGLFRQNLPTDLNALLEQGTDALLRELEISVRDNIVPLMSEQDLNDFVARMLELKARRALQPSGENEPASLGDLLATLPLAEALSHEQGFAFAKLWVEYGDTDKLWKQAELSGLSGVVPALKRTLALSELTGGYAPLVRALQTKSDAEQPESIEFLTQLEPDEWIELVYEHGVPAGVAPVEYAETLQAAVEREFPTQMLSKQLERALSKSQTFPTDKVVAFLKANPNFDLKAPHVEPYLNETDSRDEALLLGMQCVQRIFVLTDSTRETAALIEGGLHSAAQIFNMGESAFGLKVAGLISLERAGEIFAVAEKVVTTTRSRG
jgi:hypothetical protein